MDKKDLPPTESTSLLGSAISPPPYTITSSSSSTTPSAPYETEESNPYLSSEPLYPSLPSASPPAPPLSPSPSSSRPHPHLTPSYSHPTSYSLPYSGPSPIHSLPAPILLVRSHRSHRAADSRARWRIFWALIIGGLIWSLAVNVATADEMRPVRREIRKKAREGKRVAGRVGKEIGEEAKVVGKKGKEVALTVWEWIKEEWRWVVQWEQDNHVKDRVGEKFGKVIHRSSSVDITLYGDLATPVVPLSSPTGLAALD